MFENTPFPGAQTNPLNPPMSVPNTTPSGSLPPLPPTTPAGMPQPSVHTMPERFRAAGSSGGGAPGSKSTKKLVIILVVVLVVAGLGVAGLFVFQRVNNTNNTNVLANSTTVNLNTNSTANFNENVSVVVNENTNTSNANVETNTNTSTNTTANTNTVTNTNTGTPGSPLPSSADSDADGLTDVEEGVYGTDINKPDSDNDTFIDGKQVRADGTVIGEVYNGFNPTGIGKLEESTLVRRQENASKEYNVLVPTQWTATTDASGGILIAPNQQTGESIQIRINDNPNRLSPKEWYTSVSPNSNTDTMTVISINGMEALYTEDQSTIYFFKDTKVYSLQYQTGSLTQVNFRTTIDMMVRSFTLGAAS